MIDIPVFMIEGDTCAFVMGDEMGDASAFVIKGDVSAFVIKEDAPLEMCVSIACIIGDAQ
jgi:hypothetical protein